MRVLITGSSGFAAGYVAATCSAAGDQVCGLSRGGDPVIGGGRSVALDLRDGDGLRALVREVAPEAVYHLAALSSVGRSWEEPGQTLSQNVEGAVSVLEAVRHEAPAARVLWASSCEVYGTAAALPISESSEPHPENPYAVSKVTGEQLVSLYAETYGLDIAVARPFNHTGPRQRPIFIASSLASQAARARLERVGSVTIATGNPDTRRDFTDVRDVARAYRLLVEEAPAGIYNVSSGSSISAGEQVAIVAALLAPIEVVHEIDPSRVRAREVMDLRGSHEKLTNATGWQPEIPFRQTMADTIDYWERELAATLPASPA